VARRCDYTVDKKRVNSCVRIHLLLEGVEQPNISPNKPGNALSDALLMSRFQNFKFQDVENFVRSQIQSADVGIQSADVDETVFLVVDPNFGVIDDAGYDPVCVCFACVRDYVNIQ